MLLLFDMMKISVTERNYNNHPRPLHRESLARSLFLSRKYLPVNISAANRLIGEVVQLQRRPLLGPSPG